MIRCESSYARSHRLPLVQHQEAAGVHPHHRRRREDRRRQRRERRNRPRVRDAHHRGRLRERLGRRSDPGFSGVAGDARAPRVELQTSPDWGGQRRRASEAHDHGTPGRVADHEWEAGSRSLGASLLRRIRRPAEEARRRESDGAVIWRLVAALFAAAVATLAAQQQAAYLVEIDAVVTDDAGKPVAGLMQGDFDVKEDGKQVELKTFDAVEDTGTRPIPRSIVLLLDDSGVGTGNTLAIQTIARTFVARMAPPDEFSVVRLNNRRDEAFGDRLEALLRISEYRSDALPFFGRETLENALQVFARVSRTVEAIEHRRKALAR